MAMMKFNPQEDLTLYQIKEIIICLLKNVQIDENKIPNSIKRHFKKV